MRTAIAVIAFGLVIEKLNLFVLMLASATPPAAGYRARLERLAGPFGRYEGLAFILVGTALLGVAAARFIRTDRLLADQETHAAAGVRPELVLSTALAAMVAGLSIYFALG